MRPPAPPRAAWQSSWRLTSWKRAPSSTPPDGSAHLRVAERAGSIYLDLADDQWRAVEAASDGWRVISKPPVRFRRPPGLLPLPPPQRGGSLDALRRLFNFAEPG